MFEKNEIEKVSEQICSIINNFIYVFTVKGNVYIGLNSQKINDIQVCLLNIATDNYKFAKKLELNANCKIELYDMIFWNLFNNYIDAKDVDISPNVVSDNKNGNKWQLLIHNKQKEQHLVLEFAIENEKDFIWVSNAIDKLDYRLKEKEFRKVKN